MEMELPLLDNMQFILTLFMSGYRIDNVDIHVATFQCLVNNTYVMFYIHVWAA